MMALSGAITPGAARAARAATPRAPGASVMVGQLPMEARAVAALLRQLGQGLMTSTSTACVCERDRLRANMLSETFAVSTKPNFRLVY